MIAGVFAMVLVATAPIDQMFCSTDPWLDKRAPSGAIGAFHPQRVVERYAAGIEAKQWWEVIAGYSAQLDSGLAGLGQGARRTNIDSIRSAITKGLSRVPAIAAAHPTARPAMLNSLQFNQFKPGAIQGGLELVVSDSLAFGVKVMTPDTTAAEAQLLCWGMYSLWRLYALLNYESVPSAFARIEEQAARWDRYRTKGPMQLPHEMAVNRLRRWLLPSGVEGRYNPSALDFVIVHPFAGIELARIDGALRRTESVAAELGGFTAWFNDWKSFVGASWVLAYSEDGTIGRGPLVRLGGYATGGWLKRRDAGGRQHDSFIVTVDVLRLLKPDVAEKLRLKTRGVAGEIAQQAPTPAR